ncbi:flagellar assembly protein FliH [Rhodanobacter sp. B2A1Ga4]|uniref:FliH/SctL family protein n=1 Tax=Rhodanobacter TaxID=75309 RepID=UPI000D3B856B|nr:MULTISPECIES: flagellar assembly protein FliH [Rhodanobacter]MBQ4854384.1 flagellar assembly protein FliH [Rhodanobacter sp. B2A1Ga4]
MAASIHDVAAEFQRWELPNVGTRPTVTPAANAMPQPTVRELAALEQQAREEGYAAGHAEGAAAAQQQLRQRMAELNALYDAAARPLQVLDEQTGQELARLAMVVAQRVIAHELQLSPALVIQAVRQAAAALPAATRELRVHLHPADLALLRESGAAESHWQLLADPALSRGDCRLESERSRLDARVETRLAAMIDAVLGEDAADGVAGA